MSVRFGGFALALLAATAGAADTSLDAKAIALNKKLLNLDSHSDVLIDSTPERYWGPDHSSRTDLAKLRAGGVDAVAFAIAVGPGPRTPEGVAEARKEADLKLAAIRNFVRQSEGRAQIALTAADIERLRKQGKIAVIETFLNARSLGKNVNGIDEFYKAGVRVFGLTHAGNNDFADSSRPQNGEGEEHHGLSPLGKEAIAHLNSLGAIVDVSQLTPAGVFQVLSLTRAPVIATHSDVRALVDNTRNLSDEELDAIKKNGGVVSAVPFNAYLTKLPPDSGEKATLEDYVNHIDYLVQRIGIDHVGIGTDFNHGSGIPGFNDESEAPNVTRELLRRGYTEARIAKIWGGNFLRVFREVEAVSKKLR
ncbi:MAG: dipeptidase [Gammaproteobacteria bacterium]